MGCFSSKIRLLYTLFIHPTSVLSVERVKSPTVEICSNTMLFQEEVQKIPFKKVLENALNDSPGFYSLLYLVE